MRILVLEHERESPAALFGAWAAARSHTLDVIDVPSLVAWPAPDAHQAIVSLGSDCSVHASVDDWIAAEVGFLRAAHAAGTPLLGLCFGGQAIAAALGAPVVRAPRVVASWRGFPTHDPALAPPGPWLRWHEDTFGLPEGARELVPGEAGTLAFVTGATVALQYHPEADAALADRWIDGARERMVADGIEESRLRDEITTAAPQARDRAFDQFDRIAAHWEACAMRR